MDPSFPAGKEGAAVWYTRKITDLRILVFKIIMDADKDSLNVPSSRRGGGREKKEGVEAREKEREKSCFVKWNHWKHIMNYRNFKFSFSPCGDCLVSPNTCLINHLDLNIQFWVDGEIGTNYWTREPKWRDKTGREKWEKITLLAWELFTSVRFLGKIFVII